VSVSLLSCITLVASQDEFLSRHSQMCTMEVRQCPDGSSVGRDSNNDCNFHPCPSGEVCPLDAKQCPDGSWVSRDSAHDCEFQPCPDDPVVCCLAFPFCREGFEQVEVGDPECQSNPDKCEDVGLCCTTIKCKQLPTVCPQDVMQCADGSSVGRDSNNNCEFHPCPSRCVLTGGEIVNSGWSGKDTGSNSCNHCSCTDGALACTLQFCVGCTLTGGENVNSGWTGLDTGSNSCNTCGCEHGALSCTEIACQEVCTTDAKQCPDGSSVGRDSNNNCEFHPCPSACDLIPRDGKGQEMCKQRPDCEVKQDGSCGEMAPVCCEALTADCLGCSLGLSAQEFCRTIDSTATGCQVALQCDTSAGCQPDEHCRSVPGDNGSFDCQDHKMCVKRVAIGETCGGFGLPCFFEKCQTGLMCKGNDQLPDLPGVCVEEIVKETCETPIKKWEACLGHENCCESGTYCKQFSKWYAQCKPL